MVTDGQTTTANYTCTAGYSLFGEGFITCQQDKSWDHDIPYCAQCQSLNTPASLTVVMTTDGHVTTASFTCVFGYTKIGTDSSVCLSDGTWTSKNPVCVCNDPVGVQNGFVLADGNTANYSCSLGFSQSGLEIRTCADDGTGWSGADPYCALCAPLTNPIGGSFTLSSTGTVTSATYVCDSGYTLAGQQNVQCLTSGLWETVPTCVECNELQTPDSGSVTITTNGTESIAYYACASEYERIGVAFRTCSSDGIWTFTAPSCSCQSPSQPSNGLVTDDGQTAMYTCDTGYSLSGQTVRTCATDGTGWSGNDPVCVKCAVLPAIDGGGSVTATDGVQTTTSFTCDVGYTLNGASRTTCDSTGTWNLTTPECVRCPTLTDPSSGSVTISTDGYSSTATFTCAAGYYINGMQTFACLSSGHWASISPNCKCNLPTQPADGEVSVSDTASGQIATYTCNTGYTLFGASSRLCRSDGTGWVGDDPTCTSCTLPTTPPETSAVLSTDGIVTMVTYTCAKSYSLSGTSVQVCQSDGTWNGTVPTCNECPPFTTPNGGSVAIVTDGLTTSLSYTCDVGYTQDGLSSLTCNANGIWDGDEPTCVLCPALTDPASGSMSTTTNGHVSTATFTCLTGYYLSGRATLTCQTNGLWDGNPPSCECDFPASPANGDVSVKDTIVGTVAEYTCNTSYTLSGPATRVCQNDGTGWTGSEPTCVGCTLSSTPPETYAVLSTDGIVTMVTYTCAQNHSLSGTSIQVCQSDGTWNDTVPTCTQCSHINEPIGGSVTISTDTLMTSASYTCNIGYSINGVRSITCQSDGAWNGMEPTCVPCVGLSSPDNGAVTLSTDGYITTATFTCVSGYYLSGRTSVTCQTSGLWDGQSPTCECDFPNNPNNGDVSVTDTTAGTIAVYTCQTNHTLSGSSTRLCQNDGTGWAGSEPTCVSCSAITTLMPLSATLTTSGTMTSVTYACSVNYTLIGTAIQTCNSVGAWSASPPSCEPCVAKSPLPSGTIAFATDGSVTQATFTCVPGYYLNSTGTRTCLADGTWNQPDPACVCIPVNAPSNGDVVVSADGREANYTCANDYMLVGSTWRVCLNDGTGWNGTNPTCELIVAVPAASTEDGSQFPIHIGLFIALVILIVVLLGLVVFCAYRRFKLDRPKSKIGATHDKNQSVSAPDREKSFGSDKISKDVEAGKTLLIGKPTGKKPTFDVRDLTPTPPNEVPNSRFDSDRPTKVRIRKGVSSKPLDLPPRPKDPSGNLPLASVRLPKLKPQPPKGHELPRQRKRKRKKETPKENLINESSSASSSTPIELKLDRENTQDLLSTAEFNYIHPVYCHEAVTPESIPKSRPTTSSTTSKTRRSVDIGNTGTTGAV